MDRHPETPRIALLVLAALLAVARPAEADAWKTHYDAAVAAQRERRWADAEQSYLAALKEAEAVNLPDTRLAVTLNDLGLLYHVQRRWADAEASLSKARAAWENLGDGPTPQQGLATTLNNLGENYRLQRDFTQAEPLLRRGLEIREKILRPDHPEIGISLNNLGRLADVQGDFSRAEDLYRRALTVLEKSGPDTQSVATVLASLGVMYYRQGRYVQATLCVDRLLAIQLKAYPVGAPEVTGLQRRLAALKDALPATPPGTRDLERRAVYFITGGYEQAFGKPLAGAVSVTPFQSRVTGTLRWTASSIQDRGRRFPIKILAEYPRGSVLMLTVMGSPDDERLAREVLDSLATTSEPDCFWPAIRLALGPSAADTERRVRAAEAAGFPQEVIIGALGQTIVYNNNERQVCYSYELRGAWGRGKEPSSFVSADGGAFVGLAFFDSEYLSRAGY